MPDKRAVITGPPQGWMAEQERRSLPRVQSSRHEGRGRRARPQWRSDVERSTASRPRTAVSPKPNSYGNDPRRIPGLIRHETA